MLHLIHLPSGRVINVGESIEDGLVRIADSFTLTIGQHDIVPCVRLRDEGGTYSLLEGDVFYEYQVIGD